MSVNTLKVILLTRIANVGKENEIVEVNYSYAKNFLIPKKMARVLTENEVKEIQNKGKRDEQRRIANLENKHKIAETLNG
ncbi:MAG: 50S ribosomal protein L9, partial [Candidatus Gracilibacteria bacterium]|nr:50S ribosomal protein L9 [Candidatus Gracilibacteria bacterium]